MVKYFPSIFPLHCQWQTLLTFGDDHYFVEYFIFLSVILPINLDHALFVTDLPCLPKYFVDTIAFVCGLRWYIMKLDDEFADIPPVPVPQPNDNNFVEEILQFSKDDVCVEDLCVLFGFGVRSFQNDGLYIFPVNLLW